MSSIARGAVTAVCLACLTCLVCSSGMGERWRSEDAAVDHRGFFSTGGCAVGRLERGGRPALKSDDKGKGRVQPPGELPPLPTVEKDLRPPSSALKPPSTVGRKKVFSVGRKKVFSAGFRDEVEVLHEHVPDHLLPHPPEAFHALDAGHAATHSKAHVAERATPPYGPYAAGQKAPHGRSSELQAHLDDLDEQRKKKASGGDYAAPVGHKPRDSYPHHVAPMWRHRCGIVMAAMQKDCAGVDHAADGHCEDEATECLAAMGRVAAPPMVKGCAELWDEEAVQAVQVLLESCQPPPDPDHLKATLIHGVPGVAHDDSDL